MKTTTIQQLKDAGYNRDAIYQLAAGNLNLFGVAFFGHKGHKGDKRKLRNAWNRICKTFAVLLIIAFTFTSCNRYFVPDPDNKKGKCKTPVYAAICDVDTTHVHLIEREVQKASKSLMH